MQKLIRLVLLTAALACALYLVFFANRQPADPVRASNMLYKYSNPVPLPKAVRIYSSLKQGERDRSFWARPPRKKWLKLETTNEAMIGTLIEVMKERATESVQPPPTNVVTYHIYFEHSDSDLPLYYQFYYENGADQPSTLSAYTTVGNLCHAEGVERWFATNGLLPKKRAEP